MLGRVGQCGIPGFGWKQIVVLSICFGRISYTDTDVCRVVYYYQVQLVLVEHKPTALVDKGSVWLDYSRPPSVFTDSPFVICFVCADQPSACFTLNICHIKDIACLYSL